MATFRILSGVYCFKGFYLPYMPTREVLPSLVLVVVVEVNSPYG